NRFGPATYPSSRTNDGGDSFIVLEDFGPPGPEMSFSYRRSDGTSARKHSLPFAPSVQETMAMAAFVPRAASVWHFDSRTVVDVQGADGEWMVMIADPSGNVGSFETRTPSVPAGLMLAWIGEGDAGLERVLF